MKQTTFLKKTVIAVFSIFGMFSLFAQSPGGVSTDLTLWLKADFGVTTEGSIGIVNPNGSAGFAPATELNQTFTATGDGQINTATIVFNSNHTADVDISIVDGGVAGSGTVLATEALGLPVTGENTVTFSLPPTIVNGNMYQLRVTSNDSNIIGPRTSSPSYPGGRFYWGSTPSGPIDLAFEVKGTFSSGAPLEDGDAVATWLDQSGVSIGVNSNGTVPTYENDASNLANFNPSLKFTGAGDFTVNDTHKISGTNSFTIYTVTSLDSGVGAIIGAESQVVGGSAFMWHDDGYVIDETGVGAAIDGEIVTRDGVPHIGLLERDGITAMKIVVDGLSDVSNPSAASFLSYPTYRIGSNGGQGYFSGKMNEVIIYDNSQGSPIDEQKIQSYLAIKYGITLDQSLVTTDDGTGDYLASDGTTVIFDAHDGAAVSSYSNDILGIGRDDAQGLNQEVSKSVNTGAIVTLSSSNDFTTANDGSRTDLTDVQFLVMGNDGGDPTMLTSLESPNGLLGGRIDREWKLTNTNGVTTVNLKFDGFDNAATLLFDDDGDFLGGTQTTVALNASGEALNLDLTTNTGRYFTLLSTLLSNSILAQIGTEANTSVASIVTVLELGTILPAVTGLDPANETAYQTYINANPTLFDEPATQAEVQAMVTAVNANAYALDEVLEDSASAGGANNANVTAVTAVQLAAITGIINVDPANEVAYQAAIAVETGFSNPPTVAEVQAIINGVNATVTASEDALDEVLEDSASVGSANNANVTAVTAIQLAAIIGIMNVDPVNEAAYQAVINAETGFSNPPTVAEVQVIIDSVNEQAQSDAVLTQIGNEGDNPDTEGSVVTVAQLEDILPAITGIILGNEMAYQDYIDNNPDLFDAPATAAQVQTMITAVNEQAQSDAVLTQIGNEGDNPDTEGSVVTVAQLEDILPAITGIILGNEMAYQNYIDNNPDQFSSPATQTEVQLMINTVNATLGTGDIVFDSVSIFPNPTNSKLTIRGVKVENVEIFSLSGQKVLSTENSVFNLSQLQSGMYIVKIQSKNGNNTVKRLIKN